MQDKKSPYEVVSDKIEAWAKVYGYDDFLVTLRLNNEIVTEILLTNNGELEWVNDWWEGEEVELLGFIPVSKIRVQGEPLFLEILHGVTLTWKNYVDNDIEATREAIIKCPDYQKKHGTKSVQG